MRRTATCFLLAFLAAAATAAPEGEGERELANFGISYTSPDGSKQASLGVAAGCHKFLTGGKKLEAVICMSTQANNAIDQAKGACVDVGGEMMDHVWVGGWVGGRERAVVSKGVHAFTSSKRRVHATSHECGSRPWQEPIDRTDRSFHLPQTN
jgi:hypothetical protein